MECLLSFLALTSAVLEVYLIEFDFIEDTESFSVCFIFYYDGFT